VNLAIGVLVSTAWAALAVPRLGSVLGSRLDAYRDGLMAGLRQAAATAAHHRRLVCATLDAAGTLRLSIAAANPASSCSATLAGPDGQAAWVVAPSGMSMTGSPGLSLYFQPAGTVSSTATGAPVDVVLQPTGVTAITVRGRNAHAQ
jgi:MSHA pilin protein MshC